MPIRWNFKQKAERYKLKKVNKLILRYYGKINDLNIC